MSKSGTLSPGLTSKGGRPGRKPGPTALSKQRGRELAAAAREGIRADVMVEYLLAILEGHGQARIVYRAADGERCEPYVDWPAAGFESTPERKDWAWTRLREAGWGLPATHVNIQGQFTGVIAPVIDMSALKPAKIAAIRSLLASELSTPNQGAGAGQRALESTDAIDAEFAESTSEDPADGGSMSESAPAPGADE